MRKWRKYGKGRKKDSLVGDLPTCLEQVAGGRDDRDLLLTFADRLLELGLVDARQCYRIVARYGNGSALIEPEKSPQSQQLAGVQGGRQ